MRESITHTKAEQELFKTGSPPLQLHASLVNISVRAAFYSGWDGVQGTVIARCLLPGRNKKHQNKPTMPPKKKFRKQITHSGTRDFDRFFCADVLFSPFGVVVVHHCDLSTDKM